MRRIGESFRSGARKITATKGNVRSFARNRASLPRNLRAKGSIQSQVSKAKVVVPVIPMAGAVVGAAEAADFHHANDVFRTGIGVERLEAIQAPVGREARTMIVIASSVPRASFRRRPDPCSSRPEMNWNRFAKCSKEC
jgi:hypothetical protein